MKNLFLLEQKTSIAQYISEEEVISRIEMHILQLLMDIKEEKNHEFSLISRTKNNQIETDDVKRLGIKEKKRKLNKKSFFTYTQSKSLKFYFQQLDV